MNLPVILDIALGLIFIYLILSLLASEIQELLSTLLQWRAEHLKKSIEILLAGGANTEEEERVIQLANSLYNNPLIKNINQEAKGFMVNLPRKLTWLISSIYRAFMNKMPVNRRNQSIFGKQKRSGPSYIDSQTFATTLLETLRIPTVSQRISIGKLKEFKDERLVKEIQKILDALKDNLNTSEPTNNNNEAIYLEIEQKFANLKNQFDKIIKDFENGKATLRTSLDRIEEKLDIFITNIQDEFPLENERISQKFSQNLNSLKTDIFGSDPKSNQAEKLVLLGGLKPSLNEIVQTYKTYLEAKKQIKNAQNTNSPIAQIYQQKHEELKHLFRGIDQEIDKFPNSILESLEVLAIRAQAKVKSTEEDLNQLRQEIEVWFDRSMERATGVYKRNAKGIAIIIGSLIAIAANADTFYIIEKLSTDSALRDAITESASKVANKPSDIKTVKLEVENSLKSISLPIGWDLQDFKQKQSETNSSNSQISPNPIPQIQTPVNETSANQKSNFGILEIFKKVIGWLLTGVAISMGAPFWFDLLGRLINVRNAGKRPKSSADSETISDN